MKISQFVFILFVASKCASSEVLHGQNQEGIDPEKQTQDETEANDQSKRTLFASDNSYALEKHVKLHPAGYKFLLGYRPVKLTYVPVAKPLYLKPYVKTMQWRPQLSVKPVVSLLPPKVSPVYKPVNFGSLRPTALPVNVPPNIPSKPWQQQGWTAITDDAPFVPSSPEPEPDNAFVQQELPNLPPPAFPIAQPPFVQPQPLPINSYGPIASPPVFQVNSILPKPSYPVVTHGTFNHGFQLQSPVHPVFPAVPVHPTAPVPVHPVAPYPVHPAFPVNQPGHIPFDATGRPLVPINFLAGKLNIPVPDLGVLPLGSTVPVQLAQEAHYVRKPQLFVPEQHFFNKFPLPTGVLHQNHIPMPSFIHAEPPIHHQHINPQPIHPQPIYPQHQHPVHISVHQSAQPIAEHNFHQQPLHNFQRFEQTIHQQPQEPQPHISVQQSPEQNVEHYQPDNYHQYEQQGNNQESPGFFQPGKTDLQIPEYLPEHPHFKPSQFLPESDYESHNVK